VNKDVVRIVNIVNQVLHDLLAHVQTLAILLAALIAADFFIFTPTVKSSVVEEYRVSRSAVIAAYAAGGTELPPAVMRTLDDLANRTMPIGPSTTVVNTGTAGSASSQLAPSASGAASAAAAAGVFYPMAEICSRSRETAEAAFQGACATATQQDLPPPYDRALLHFDEEPGLTLAAEQLRFAIDALTSAVFVHATVNLSNTGKATAQNVNILAPDGYSPKSTTLSVPLSVNDKPQLQFDTGPGVLTSTQGAIVTNPALFTVKWDPTGPLDPQVTMKVVLAGIGVLVVLGVLDLIQAIASDGKSPQTTPGAEPEP
jgi:hypothetical protein